MISEEETGQQQRTARFITIPMVVLDGWVGHNDRYLKWWTWLRREAGWTEREVWFNRQQVYLQARQVRSFLHVSQMAGLPYAEAFQQ